MKKKPLVVASMSGRIYQGNILKSGLISDTKVDMTSEVLTATQEWFMKNKDYKVEHELMYDGGTSYLFHTIDDEKAEQIIKILEG